MNLLSTDHMMLLNHLARVADTEPYTGAGEYHECNDHLIARYGPSKPQRVRSPYRRRVCLGCGVVARADVFGVVNGICNRKCKRCAAKDLS